MKFKDAFDIMVRDGKEIKRKSWSGFWRWQNGTIWITTREGETIDIRETTDVSYTIRNMLEDDWEICKYIKKFEVRENIHGTYLQEVYKMVEQ